MEICEHHSNRLFAYIFVDTVYNVHTRVLHVCGIIIIIIIQEKINVAFSPKWTSRTRYNVKKLT